MIEVSVILFTLISEGFVLLLVILILWAVLTMRRNRRDRLAIGKLIEQVKHQSRTRLETTGSFLSEKYRFEGDELKQAVKLIDKAEKKFMQKLMQVYLQRDAEELPSMDAHLAELIDAYKSLSPVMPDAEALASQENGAAEEMTTLRETNTRLKEELSITKETMASMISEFGNMFGGGHDHELAKHEVVEKVEAHSTTHPEAQAPALDPVETDNGIDDIALEEDIDVAAEGTDNPKPADDNPVADVVKDSEIPEDVLADDGVDELLDSIDLSDDK